MKILVTGVAGQLGYDVVYELNKRGCEILNSNHYTLHSERSSLNFVLGADRADFDITDANATECFIKSVMPDAVIHCSAYTAVDAAEENEELCRAVNVDGTANIAKVCKEIGTKMLYISTDYVFGDDSSSLPPSFEGGVSVADGGSSLHSTLCILHSEHRPHEVNDECCPLNVYGQSKLDGELAVKSILDKYFIVRTSWVFGHHGKNFVETMLRLGKGKESLNVVADQIGSPTFTEDLAVLLVDMIVTEKYGTYHATNEGICSWAEFSAEIMRLANLPCKINSITTAEYLAPFSKGGGEAGGFVSKSPRVAVRPLNSRLSKKSLDENGFKRLPEWQDALERYLGDADR